MVLSERVDGYLMITITCRKLCAHPSARSSPFFLNGSAKRHPPLKRVPFHGGTHQPDCQRLSGGQWPFGRGADGHQSGCVASQAGGPLRAVSCSSAFGRRVHQYGHSRGDRSRHIADCRLGRSVMHTGGRLEWNPRERLEGLNERSLCWGRRVGLI